MRLLSEYTLLARAGEGAYGLVTSARDRSTNKQVALKKITFDPKEGVPVTLLREVRVGTCGTPSLRNSTLTREFWPFGQFSYYLHFPCFVFNLPVRTGLSFVGARNSGRYKLVTMLARSENSVRKTLDI